MGNPNPAYAGDLESHRGLTQLDEAGAAGALQDPAGDLAARGQASDAHPCLSCRDRIFATLLVQLGKLLLENDLVLGVRLVHRLLFEEGR